MLLAVCALLLLNACSDDSTDTGDPGPKSRVLLTGPSTSVLFFPAGKVWVSWKVREGAGEPDSVCLQYRGLDPETAWRIIATFPTRKYTHTFTLPDSLTGRFEIRIQGNGDEAWDVVSPLFASVILVRLTAPVGGQHLQSESSVSIRWDLDFPDFPSGFSLTDTGTVEIQFTPLGGKENWQRIATPRAGTRTFDWKLPSSLGVDFALRARSMYTNIWSTVSPLHVSPVPIELPRLQLISPKAGSIFRLGSTIPIRWESSDPLGAGDFIEVEYAFDSRWFKIGTFPFLDHGLDWTPKEVIDHKYSLRIRQVKSPDWSLRDSIWTAEIRILNYPPGTVLRRGTGFQLEVKIYVPWNKPMTTLCLLSSDGGATWPITMPERGSLLDYPPAANCRLRLHRDDLPFEDTTATFAITENLTDYPMLMVGQHYVYQYKQIKWELFTGMPIRREIAMPDAHIVVHGKTILSDRTVYDVSYWSDGRGDTLRTTAVESHEGLHRITADFLPFSIDRIFARLDADSETVTYDWGINSRFVLHRNRGLLFAVERHGSVIGTIDYEFTLR